jgi:ribulose-phosphate 3-epimerase
VQAQISLSILGYETELSENMENILNATVATNILDLVNSGKLYSLHIDVMRRPFISKKSVFPIKIIKQIYDIFNNKINLNLHLIVAEPLRFTKQINQFIQSTSRTQMSVIIQYEAYNKEDEIIEDLRILKDTGYKIGIGLDLKTPIKKLTNKIVENVDFVFLMCVPMGKGGQIYDKQATNKIEYVSNHFSEKIIEVDGGLNDITVSYAKNAGATIFVIGSYITSNKEPLKALNRIKETLKA